MAFWDPIVQFPSTTFRRVAMLVNEIEYMNTGEELTGLDLEHETENFIKNIVDEYIRQYFEESTRQVAQLTTRASRERTTMPRYRVR